MCEQVDLPGELMDIEEEQQLLNELFQVKFSYTLPQIKGVMSCRFLTFQQMLDRYQDTLVGWMDDEAQKILRILQDGAYLQEVWSWLENDSEYKKWVDIYNDNYQRLDQIAAFYLDHDDMGNDFRVSAQEAKNELYLTQTQPANPLVDTKDSYTGEAILLDKFPTDLNGSVKHPPRHETGDYAKLQNALKKAFNTAFLPKSFPPCRPKSFPTYAVVDDNGSVYTKYEFITKSSVEVKLPDPIQVKFFDVPNEPEAVIKKRPFNKPNFHAQMFPLPIRGTAEVVPSIPPVGQVDRFPKLNNRQQLSREDYFNEYIAGSAPKGDGDYDRYLGVEENDLFDDRGITSVPINQAEELEYKPKDYLSLRFSDVGKLIHKIRSEAIKIRRENFKQRHAGPKRKLVFNPKTNQYRLVIKPPIKKKYISDDQLQGILEQKFFIELEIIITRIQHLLACGTEPQDALLLVMDGTYIDFILPAITMPLSLGNARTLAEFAENFEHEVLDNALCVQDPAGWYDSSEIYYASVLRSWDPSHAIQYDDSKLEWSRLFNEVVIEHILSGYSVSESYKQAYHACKMASSPNGEIAYRQVLASGKTYGEAMHAFYQAAYQAGDLERPRDRVVSVHPDKVVVLTGSSDYQATREVNWKVARIKAQNRELFVASNADLSLKQRMFNAVNSLNWNKFLIANLRE